MGYGHPPAPPPVRASSSPRSARACAVFTSRPAWAGLAPALSFFRALSLFPTLTSAGIGPPASHVSGLSGTELLGCPLEKALPGPLPTLSPIRAWAVPFF